MSKSEPQNYCPACGSEVPPQARLCHACGAALARVPESGAEPEPGVPAEQAAGVSLPVGIAPRGPWQDGTAIGLKSDAQPPDDDSELDLASLPPEVAVLLKSPPVQPDSGIMGSGLTWPRVIGCLIGMALLAALALFMLYMLQAARRAVKQMDSQSQGSAAAPDSPEAPPSDIDQAAPNEPAPVQGLQGGAREEAAEPEPGDAAGTAEPAPGADGGSGGGGSGDSLF
ncbi:zinc ribbon domain-containing protein [bacterium]|nr:zinc ribbon domain-containing protein [bacterium]